MAEETDVLFKDKLRPGHNVNIWTGMQQIKWTVNDVTQNLNLNAPKSTLLSVGIAYAFYTRLFPIFGLCIGSQMESTADVKIYENRFRPGVGLQLPSLYLGAVYQLQEPLRIVSWVSYSAIWYPRMQVYQTPNEAQVTTGKWVKQPMIPDTLASGLTLEYFLDRTTGIALSAGFQRNWHSCFENRCGKQERPSLDIDARIGFIRGSYVWVVGDELGR